MPNANDNHNCPNNQDNHQHDYHLPKMNSSPTSNNNAWWQQANKMGRPLDNGDTGGGHNEGTWRPHDNKDNFTNSDKAQHHSLPLHQPIPLFPPPLHQTIGGVGHPGRCLLRPLVSGVWPRYLRVCDMCRYFITLCLYDASLYHNIVCVYVHAESLGTSPSGSGKYRSRLSFMKWGTPLRGIERWLSWCEKMAAFHCRPAFFIGHFSLHIAARPFSLAAVRVHPMGH